MALVDYCPLENVYRDPENGVATPCSELWRRLFVLWDGGVGVCESDFMETLKPRQGGASDIAAAWTGHYQRLRERHVAGRRQSVEPCRRCPVR